MRASRAALLAAVRLVCAALLAPLVAWQGCAVYDRSLLVDRDADAGIGADAAIDADAGTDAEACRGMRWPERPAADSPTTTPDVRFVAALRRLSLTGTVDAGVSPAGYDLDDDCTCCACSVAPTTGYRGACRPREASEVCDDAIGRDNTAGALFGRVSRRADSKDIFSEHNLNLRLERGEVGMLLEVKNYNEQPDDHTVLAALYPSNGVVSPDGGLMRARWDGTDRWSRDPDGLVGGGTTPVTMVGVPRYVDDSAYVADGTLVARIDFPLSLGSSGGGNAIIELSGAVLTGRLVREGAGYRVENGQIAGRWATRKLLTSLAVYTDPIFPGVNLCGDSSTYLELKKLICSAADIAAAPSADHTGAACDALSIAIGFASHPALLGPARAVARPPPGCDAGWTDDCTGTP